MIKKYLVLGKVQDVGYRFFTQKIGRKLNLNGYVKNLENGSVKVVVEYLESNNFLQQEKLLLKQLRQGPNFSRVEGIKIETISKANNLRKGFFIER